MTTVTINGVVYSAVVLLGSDGAALLSSVAEDAAHASGDKGIMAMAVRKDTPTALAGADGDYAPLEVDSLGRLWVRLPGSDVTNNVQKVAELCTLSTILTADGQMVTGVGVIVKVFIFNTHATETATLQLYDNTAGSGTKLGGLINVPPVNGGREIELNIPFGIGVYADVTLGTVSMWCTYRSVI